MSTVQEIITAINLQYRNSYTTPQKVEWMDKVQKQIFQKVKHEAEPYTFETVEDNAFYPIPSDCDPKGIKEVTIETGVGTDKYRTLHFVNVSSNQRVGEQQEFYSIQGNENFYINPLPTADTEGKNVYVIYNKRPATLSSDTAGLAAVPDLNVDFHELLELGVLERIARARGEVVDKNNFAADFNGLLREYMDQFKEVLPEYIKTNNVLPQRRGRRSRRSSMIDLIPEVT